MAATGAHLTRILLPVALSVSSLTGCTGSDGPASSTATPVSLHGEKLEDLSMDQPEHWAADASNWTVRLHWATPAGEVDHYVIARDGITLDDQLTEPVFVDEVLPGSGYGYQVWAVGADGARSRPAAARFRTGAPPLEQARFKGLYFVRLTPVDWNTTQKPHAWGSEFFLNPRCPRSERVCDLTWQNEAFTARGVLTRNGLSYRGTARGDMTLHDCFGNDVGETIEIALTAVGAHGEEGEWNVDRIEGTLTETGDHVSGCLDGTITWDFKTRFI